MNIVNVFLLQVYDLILEKFIIFLKYLKLKLAKFFRKSSFSKLSIREWHLRDFSSFEKKILTLQHFCDITPKNTDIIECGVGAGSSYIKELY